MEIMIKGVKNKREFYFYNIEFGNIIVNRDFSYL